MSEKEIEMKQGLTYISDRGSQLRYSDKDGKEQWIQQVSRYKALETIKRGQAVSIASSEDFETYAINSFRAEYPDLSEEEIKGKLAALENDPDPYVVLTNTQKHVKCIGLALEPAKVGQEIHILPFGKFTFDKDYETVNNTEADIFEYNPNFTYKDVGKRVYVRYPLDEMGEYDETCIGNLTVDEDEVLRYYHNIICVGYLTDAPRESSDDKTTTIELSIQGDYRGPVDNTQFEGILGEDVSIAEEDPIRLFAIGKEDNTKFHHFLRLTPQNKEFTERDFIAVQKLDGRTAFIYPKLGENNFNPNSVIDDNDKTFIYMSKVYRSLNKDIEDSDGCIPIEINDNQTIEGINSNIALLTKALEDAFHFVAGDTYDITVQSKTPTNPIETGFFGTLDIQANQDGGYYEIYISSGLLNRFEDSVNFSHGSFDNKGKVVLADIRIPSRREVLGVYIGNKFGNLKKDYSSIFMKTGEYKLSGKALASGFYNIGDEYYLGFNGRLTKNLYKQYEYLQKVAFQKDKNKLIFNIEAAGKYYDGVFPVGYMKPSVDGKNEYGFLLMDGETEYPKEDPYLELYKRLTGWFPTSDIDVPEKNTFKVPKVFRTIPDIDGHKDVVMQIKYLATGIYEDMPIFPFIREFGNFEKETENTFIKPSIKEVDITSLIDIGFEENGFANPDVSNLDIHLYVDPNKDYVDGAHNWIEVRSGFFNYNNSNTYGFDWKLETKEPSNSAPFGKVVLYTNIGNGEGISYVGENNSAPIKLAGCPYKVYVAKREMFPRQIDLGDIPKNYISNSVYTDDTEQEVIVNKAVSGKAVLDAIKNRTDIDSLEINPDATIELGKKDAPLSILSLVSKGTVPFVADRIEIANNFDKIVRTLEGEETLVKSPKLIVEKDRLFIENAKDEDLYVLAPDNINYNIDGEQIPTVKQVRSHAEKTIDNTDLRDLIKKGVDNKHGAIHGMVFGVDGNIDASVLNGLKLGLSSKSIVTSETKLDNSSYIPYIYKDESNKYIQNVEGSLNFLLPKNDGLENALKENISYNTDTKVFNRNYTLESADSDIFAFSVGSKNIIPNRYRFSQEFNFNNGSIGFYKYNSDGNKSPANVIFGGMSSGSRSEYKRIYGEKRRSDLYEITETGEIEKKDWTPLADGSINYTDGDETIESTNKFTNLLGSALQAAYELPMAYWQYRTEEDWYKKSMGVIVERVDDVVKNINYTMKRNLFEGVEGSDFEHPDSQDINHNEFNYTSKEVDSIKAYLNDIINNSSTGVNITDTVGLLLKAAQETQERLLKIETSTFGDDYETIPGERFNYDLTGLDPTVTHNPTNLGLNRLIRAICLEIYQTANPTIPSEFDPEGGGMPILSRVDKLDIDIHGRLNEIGVDSKTSENEFKNITSTTYPYDDVVNSTEIKDIRESESTDEKQQKIAEEKGLGVVTREKMTKPDVPATGKESIFNGVVDAIYRITTKLNALTESVNGTDNIANAPLRLNTIRQNIEHIIRESYFDDKYVINETGETVDIDGNGTPIYTKSFIKEEANPYKDTNESLNTPFDNTNSRFDNLTRALYDFTISKTNASQEFGKFKEFGEEIQEDSETPVYYTGRKFNGKNLLTDNKVDEATTESTEVKSHIPQNLNDYNYATLLDIVIDAIGDRYYRSNALIDPSKDDAKNAKEVLRYNKTISERLDTIEKALDTVVLKLSRKKHFENDTETLGNTSFSIESYTSFINEYLGYSQINFVDSDWDNEQSSFEESFKDGINSEDIENKFSAEYAFEQKKNIQAGLVNTLYRLQKEEAVSERYDSILGDDFSSKNTNIEQIAKPEPEDAKEKESYQKGYETKSTYNLTDDIKDVLKTLYGEDTSNPEDSTSYTHRTLVSINENGNINDRFVNNTKDDNIIDKMINESYYLPQPVLSKADSSGELELMVKDSADDRDSRNAKYFDFDYGKNIYDIKKDENALSNNHRKEFFNTVGRNKDTKTDIEHTRYSRFDVIENEIRSERKLLGNNIEFTNYRDNPNAVDLKFKGILEFDEDSSSFKGIEFNDISEMNPTTDQFNKSGKTSILQFMLGIDKAGRIVRNELGHRNGKGYDKYLKLDENNGEYHVVQQPQDRKSLYDRTLNLESLFEKFTGDTDSLLNWD